MHTPLDSFLRQFDTPEFKRAHRARLAAEATAANTYLDEHGNCIQEWPAHGERRIIKLKK